MSSTKLIREFIEFTSPLFANIKAEKPLMFFDPSVRLEIKTSDMSLSFITKTPPTSSLIFEYSKIKKGSGEPNKEKVGTITKNQIKQIAEIKMPDLNASDIESAMSMVSGTARSMGITVKG